MNRRQGAVLAVGLATLLGMAAYCPWYVKEPQLPGPPVITPDGAVIGGDGPDYRADTVYRWCWDPPVPQLHPATVRVNWARLLLQAAGAVVAAGAGIWLLRSPAGATRAEPGVAVDPAT